MAETTETPETDVELDVVEAAERTLASFDSEVAPVAEAAPFTRRDRDRTPRENPRRSSSAAPYNNDRRGGRSSGMDEPSPIGFGDDIPAFMLIGTGARL